MIYEEVSKKINELSIGRFRLRAILKPRPEDCSREELFDYYENPTYWNGDDVSFDDEACIECIYGHREKRVTVDDIINGLIGCSACEKHYFDILFSLDDTGMEKRKVRKNGRCELVGVSSKHRRSLELSLYKLRCIDCGDESNANAGQYFDSKWVCRKCENNTRGFRTDKAGYLYALRSECGLYVKVGISNKPKRRMYELSRSTPFKFNAIEQIKFRLGRVALDNETIIHNRYERAGFTGFDGATEWLVCTPELLEELRELEDVK